MLVHRRSLPRNFARFPQQFAGTHLYTWVERGTVRVKCLAQEHNAMSPARARTRTARSRVERTNHEATAPPRGVFILYFLFSIVLYGFYVFIIFSTEPLWKPLYLNVITITIVIIIIIIVIIIIVILMTMTMTTMIISLKRFTVGAFRYLLGYWAAKISIATS